MKVVENLEATVSIHQVLKHPENYNIIGMVKFVKCNYLYKLAVLGRNRLVWVNLNRSHCLNEFHDSAEALEFKTTADALAHFMDGSSLHELHAFNRREDYLDFLSKHI